jgi:hypothetical protein
MKMIATTLTVVMLLTAFGTSAHAGLFTKIKETVKNNPVKSALAGVAAVGGAVLAAPYLASAVGFASGTVAGVAGGATAAVAGAGVGLAGIGSTIWGGLCAAGGFVTGPLAQLAEQLAVFSRNRRLYRWNHRQPALYSSSVPCWCSRSRIFPVEKIQTPESDYQQWQQHSDHRFSCSPIN